MGDAGIVSIDIYCPIDVYIDITTAPIPRPPARVPEGPYAGPPSKPEHAKTDNRSPIREVVVWGISGPPPSPVNHRGVIIRHIDNFGIGGLDLDILSFNYYFLLFGRLEITLGVSF